MTPEELLALRRTTNPDPVIGVHELADGWTARTLVFGYDTERTTFHAYLQKGWFYVVTYRPGSRVVDLVGSGPALKAEALVPNKRVYPETVSFEFARLLHRKGVEVSYANFGGVGHLAHRETYPFWGRTV